MCISGVLILGKVSPAFALDSSQTDGVGAVSASEPMIEISSGVAPSAPAKESPRGKSFGKGYWFSYYGMESHGKGAGLSCHNDLRRWLSTDLDLNIFAGLSHQIELVGGYVQTPATIKTDVMPRVQASFFLHPPWGILKIVGVGLGVEAYYFHTRLNSFDPVYQFRGTASGFHLDYFYPMFSVGVHLNKKNRPYRFAATLQWSLQRSGNSQSISLHSSTTGLVGTAKIAPLRPDIFRFNIGVQFAKLSD